MPCDCDALRRSLEWAQAEKRAAQADAEREKNVADTLRADLAAREREGEALRAQVDGLRGALALAEPITKHSAYFERPHTMDSMRGREWTELHALVDAAHAALSATPAEHRSHPEDYCQRCGGPNVVWFAPNELWNQVMGSGDGIVCPVCFVKAAERVGISAVWCVTPDSPEHRSQAFREGMERAKQIAVAICDEAVRDPLPIGGKYRVDEAACLRGAIEVAIDAEAAQVAGKEPQS